jgi:hypothetical protein
VSFWDQAIEDSVGDGGLGDVFVPFSDGDLGGYYGAGTLVTVFENLE